jgi:adenylyltransferase/sulfurtransferase
MVGAQEAAEAIKVMIGRADLCDRSLREFDLWTNAQRRIDVGSVKDAACPACALHRFEFLEGAGDQEVAVICTRTGGGAVQVSPARDRRTTVDTQRMKSSLAAHGEFTANQFVLRGVLSRESDESNHPIELTVFHDGRAIIRGTTEPAVARSIYARYIGD